MVAEHQKKQSMTTLTISGPPGSGTTTVAELLKEKLGVKHVYAGNLYREKARKYGMSLEEFGKYCEKHEEIDRELDEFQLSLLKKGKVILEGRMAGWIAFNNKIPCIKVLLKADLNTRAERIVKREGGELEKRKQEIKRRERSESIRYKKYYDIELNDTSIYDLTIDTSNKTPEEIVEIIIRKVKENARKKEVD
jgi:predicted cytidylate kinase